MTTYGLDIVLRCNACQGHIIRHSLTSGNTFDARYWTDGWRDAPMLPEVLPLIKCGHCGKLVWVNELKEVAEIEPDTDETESLGPLRSEKAPRLEDYVDFLNGAGDLDNERLLYVRRRIWWTGNHKRRNVDYAVPLTDAERSNLESLAKLFSTEDENDRLSKAEALRELGEFEGAAKLLATSFPEGMASAARFIGKLVEQQDSQLRELIFS